MCSQHNFWFSGPRSEGSEQAEQSSKACCHGSLAPPNTPQIWKVIPKSFKKVLSQMWMWRKVVVFPEVWLQIFFSHKFPSHIIFSCLFWSLTNRKFSHLYGIQGFRLPAREAHAGRSSRCGGTACHAGVASGGLWDASQKGTQMSVSLSLSLSFGSFIQKSIHLRQEREWSG